MRHRMQGKRLGRSTTHRIAMRRNMAASLFQHGAIRTTVAKAKELRRFVEKLITQAKKGTLHARRRVLSELGRDTVMFDDEGEAMDATVVQRLFDEIAPRYADRPGGYTRIIRIGERRIGDAGEQVILQLVEEELPDRSARSGPSRRRRRASRRHQAAEAAGAATATQEPPADEAAGEQPPADEQPDSEPEAAADAEGQSDQGEEDSEEKA